MLKGISPLISPDLLKVLAQMGHGDEIVLSDAHFPAYSLGVPVLRADGISAPALTGAVLQLMDLDQYVEKPVVMMAPVPGDTLNESLMAEYRAILKDTQIDFMERFAFYERTRRCFAVVVTGECRQYGNIILKKGVIL